MTSAARSRLILYIVIGTLPQWISWVTLTWDLTPRGLIIIASSLVLTGAVNWRAFIDTHGKPPNNDPPPTPKEHP